MFSFYPAYFVYSLLIVFGLSGIVMCDNLIKRLISMNILQVGILFFYISICYKSHFHPPLYGNVKFEYINPVPQVLMLTAIVVGLSVTAVGLSLIMKISKHFKTIYDSEIK